MDARTDRSGKPDKHCGRCGLTKPRTEFYISKMGYAYAYCKICSHANARRCRLNKIDEYRARERARRPADRADYLRAYAATPEGKARVSAAKKRYAKRHPGRHRAQMAAKRAIRRGKLIREVCEMCGDPKTHAHHDDYGKPLSVRWLCKQHHLDWHKNNTPVDAIEDNPDLTSEDEPDYEEHDGRQ